MTPEEPLDPLLEDWLEERVSPGQEPVAARDRELFLLLTTTKTVPRGLSDQDSARTLERIQERIATGPSELRGRDLLLAAAAVVAGLAIGHSAVGDPSPFRDGSTAEEIIKRSSFESIQEDGRVVRFHLELKKTH